MYITPSPIGRGRSLLPTLSPKPSDALSGNVTQAESHNAPDPALGPLLINPRALRGSCIGGVASGSSSGSESEGLGPSSSRGGGGGFLSSLLTSASDGLWGFITSLSAPARVSLPTKDMLRQLLFSDTLESAHSPFASILREKNTTSWGSSNVSSAQRIGSSTSRGSQRPVSRTASASSTRVPRVPRRAVACATPGQPAATVPLASAQSAPAASSTAAPASRLARAASGPSLLFMRPASSSVFSSARPTTNQRAVSTLKRIFSRPAPGLLRTAPTFAPTVAPAGSGESGLVGSMESTVDARTAAPAVPLSPLRRTHPLLKLAPVEPVHGAPAKETQPSPEFLLPSVGYMWPPSPLQVTVDIVSRRGSADAPQGNGVPVAPLAPVSIQSHAALRVGGFRPSRRSLERSGPS